jgi:hypothetical protein
MLVCYVCYVCHFHALVGKHGSPTHQNGAFVQINRQKSAAWQHFFSLFLIAVWGVASRPVSAQPATGL